MLPTTELHSVASLEVTFSGKAIELFRLPLLILSFFVSFNVLEAQDTTSMYRFKQCLSVPEYNPTSNEPTLCDDNSGLNDSTADQVIGTSSSSITRASDLTSSIWFNQELIIKGTFIVDAPTWFINCKVKMEVDASIEVENSIRLYAVFSDFFACDDMWQGITLNPAGIADIWHCNIEDAEVALLVTALNEVSLVGDTFNRNHIGIRSRTFLSPTLPIPWPTQFSPSYFVNNTFLVTNDFNEPNPGKTIGIDLVSTQANLLGDNQNPNQFVGLEYGILARNKSNLLLGAATFDDQNEFGVSVEEKSGLTIPLAMPCTFTNNFVAGIQSINSGLDINGCTFAESFGKQQSYGIISTGGNEGDISIKKNNLNFEGEESLIAIIVERGANQSIFIEDNKIDISSSSVTNGIYIIPGSGGVSLNGDCKILRNTIDFQGNNVISTEQNYGIRVFDAGRNIDISQDTVYFNSDRSKMSGIIMSDCEDDNKTISGNIVDNLSFPTNFLSAEVGIEVVKSRKGNYCTNVVNASQFGMSFFGNNDSSNVEQNEFIFHNNHGLQVAGNGAASAEPAIIGVQFRKANRWTGATQAQDASFGGGDVFLSRILIHSSSAIFSPPPFEVVPNNWFLPSLGTPNFTCTVDQIIGSTTLDEKVANGTYFDSTSTPLAYWQMEHDLMYQLLADTSYGSGNPVFDTFYTNTLPKTSGQFAKVKWDLKAAYTLDKNLKESIDSLKNEKVVLIDSLVVMSDTSSVPDTVTQVDALLGQSKKDILDALDSLDQEIYSLTASHDSLVLVKLQDIRDFNDSITTAYTFEQNQKTINEILIKEALGQSITSSDISSLESIASQADSVAGSTNRRARAFLPCLGYINTTERTINPSESDVKGVSALSYTLAPNPASSLTNLIFSSPFTGLIEVFNLSGQLVKQIRLTDEIQVTINCVELNEGLYFLKIQSNDGSNNVLKLVVSRK